MGLRVLTPCDVLICRWCDKNELLLFGVTSEKALRAYFLAAANIFEPDRTVEGLMWTRTSLVTEALLALATQWLYQKQDGKPNS
jgi:hypothetical protein